MLKNSGTYLRLGEGHSRGHKTKQKSGPTTEITTRMPVTRDLLYYDFLPIIFFILACRSLYSIYEGSDSVIMRPRALQDKERLKESKLGSVYASSPMELLSSVSLLT